MILDAAGLPADLPGLNKVEAALIDRISPERFAALNDPRYEINPMVADLGGEVARAVLAGARDGRHRFILAEAPPRHGKSYTLTQKTPPWLLSLFPHKQVAIVAYESNFAATWGRKVRDEIESYGERYGIRVRGDSRSASDFGIEVRTDAGEWERGGGVFCTGIGGPLTGRGFHLLIIDDPIKNAEEAASQTIRDKHWEWWQSTASTRLEPGAVVVLMMTRWNEDDLAGRLLQAAEDDETAPQWLRLRYPALCEEDGDRLGRKIGEALWPERWDAEYLRGKKSTSGPYYWAAMFQQRPAPLEGGMCEPGWFKYALAPSPEHVHRVRAWDLAGSKDSQRGDYAVGVLLARSPSSRDHVRLEDVNRLRGRPGDIEEEVLATAEADGPSVVIQLQQDPGQAGLDQVERYKRLLRGYKVEIYKPTGEKEVRAIPFMAKVQAGHFELVKADWNADFVSECCVFPNGRFDDQVDAVSSGLAYIETKAPKLLWKVREAEHDEERRRTSRLIEKVTPARGRRRSNYREIFRAW